jgi:hypothetical protein
MATNPPAREGATAYTNPPIPVVDEYIETRTYPLRDRVRWASIIAGLFTVLSMLVLFTVLGIALGLSSFDANNPRSFGIGAGIYGIVSALIAFAIGGFVAARTAAVTGTDNALLQSGMVWMVTIALIVNFIGSGVGTLLNVAGGAVDTAVTGASNVAGMLQRASPRIPRYRRRCRRAQPKPSLPLKPRWALCRSKSSSSLKMWSLKRLKLLHGLPVLQPG